MKRRWTAAGAAAAMVALGGVAHAQTSPASSETSETGFDFDSPEIVAEGLDIPWGMDFLPDGDALFAQRDTAEIFQVSPDSEPEAVAEISDVVPGGEGGLLGLAVSPDYEDDGYVYVYYTSDSDNRVARLSLDDAEPEVLLDGIPKADIHNGGRVAFGPDGMLYATTGDAADPDIAQDPENLGGKILRMEADGGVPDDNPFDDSVVYSIGHRNVQGIAWASDGEAYASELGENTWDEVNHILAGENYGWPIHEGPGDDPDYQDPIEWWEPAEASPSGAAMVDDTLFVTALRGERLWLVSLDGEEPQSVLEGDVGRIRTVEQGEDGWLWIATSNGGDDQIVRYPPE